MSARLFENDAVTGWVLTAALHSLAVGLVFWLVLALVRRNGPSESCWFGRAGTAALLMLPLTLLAVGHLNRESPPVPNPVPPAITEPIVERARLVIPFPDPDRPVESAAPVRRNPVPIAMNVLGAVWILGVMLLLVRTGRGVVKMRDLRRQLRAPDPDADGALHAQLERLGIAPSKVRVAETDTVPFATGIFSPIIVVPANLFSLLKPHEARMILRHELAHLQNHDLAWAVAQAAARVLHWWNPFACSLVRQTELASEGLCDHAALSGERGRNSKAYAHCLVDLAERITLRRLPSGSGALSVTGDFRRLKRRLLWINAYRPAGGAGYCAVLKLLALSLVIASAVGLTALNAGAELPAKKGPVATTRQGSDKAAATKIGAFEIDAEETSYHGKEGRISFKDVKVVTPFYECRARTAEFAWDKDHPKDLDKSMLRLGGGVSADIRGNLALSETAEIHPGTYAIELRGFPRVTNESSSMIALAEKGTLRIENFRNGGHETITQGKFSNRIGTNLTRNVEKKRGLEDKAAKVPADTGMTLEADSAGSANEALIAKGNVRIAWVAEGTQNEITGDEAACMPNSSKLVVRKNVRLKLRGHEVSGERATVDVNAMTARIQGPGSYVKDGRRIRYDENSEVEIGTDGINLVSMQWEVLNWIEDNPEGIIRSNQGKVRHPRFPVGDFYPEGWDMWRNKRFNQSPVPSTLDDLDLYLPRVRE